jgi:hypothetical protein
MRWARIAAAAVAATLLVSGVATADSVRVTEGDANAVLQAFGNGGWTILLHAQVVEGAPYDGLVEGLATIRPYKAFNNKHYCALDWHTLVVGDIEGGDSTYALSDAEAIISQMDARFSVDGVPVGVVATAIKPFAAGELYGLENAYIRQWGHIFAPADLAPGRHTVSAEQSLPLGEVWSSRISIVVDPAGTGVCV